MYIMEVAALVMIMAVYKNDGKPLTLLLTGRYSHFFLSGAVSFFGSGAYLVVKYHRARPEGKRHIWQAVGMNAVVVAACLGLGETAIRVFGSRRSSEITFMHTQLLPHQWDEVRAHNRALLERSPSNISYFVPDDLLGWSIGPSRRSGDGLYSSSVEGIRSPSPGVSYGEHRPAHRIALIGDSFTFGLEVPFEATWGDRLQQGLGPEVQVLNFGVDGYGVDQAYLRYSKDVQAWQPDLVILGFICNDLYRSMAVYTFVSFPEWEFPFAKPRFIDNRGELELLNVPVLDPQEIVAHRAVSDLPYIEYDRGYNQDDWQWKFYHHSYLIRFLISRFPRWHELAPNVSNEAVKVVNSEIFTAFAHATRVNGTKALVVYLPSRSDFSGNNERDKEAIFAVLQEEQILHVDLKSCLKQRVGYPELFISGRPHYSPAGNAAVAECLTPLVRACLN